MVSSISSFPPKNCSDASGDASARRAGAGRTVGRSDGREPLLPGEGEAAGAEAKGRRDRRARRRFVFAFVDSCEQLEFVDNHAPMGNTNAIVHKRPQIFIVHKWKMGRRTGVRRHVERQTGFDSPSRSLAERDKGSTGLARRQQSVFTPYWENRESDVTTGRFSAMAVAMMNLSAGSLWRSRESYLLKKGSNHTIENGFLIIIDKFYFKVDKEKYFE